MNKLKELVKTANMKKLVKGLTFVFGLVLVIVISIVDAGLDPTKLDFYTWLGKSLILVGIMVYGLLMGESIGSDSQTQNPNGLYQKNLHDYNALNKELEPLLIYFSQFYFWFVKREIRKKKIDFLRDNNVDIDYADKIVDFINKNNVHQLSFESGYLIEEIDFVIPQQTETQLAAIKEVIEGKIKIKEPKETYYLNAFSSSKSKSVLDTPESIDAQIKFNKAVNRAFKIISSLAISILWGMITVNEFMGGDDPNAQAQAWSNLVARVVALFTSFISGWGSAAIDTKLRARKLKDKYNMLTTFKSAYDKNEFEIVDKQAVARAKYDETKKREAEIEIITPLMIEQKKTE